MSNTRKLRRPRFSTQGGRKLLVGEDGRPHCWRCGRLLPDCNHIHVYHLRDMPGRCAAFCCGCIPAVRRRVDEYERRQCRNQQFRPKALKTGALDTILGVKSVQVDPQTLKIANQAKVDL